MQTIPSSFDICCFVFAKMNKRILLINKIPQSIIDSFSTCSGERMAENPRINKMFKQVRADSISECKTAISFLVATMEVNQFRKGGSDCNDGKSDKVLAYAEVGGNDACFIND